MGTVCAGLLIKYFNMAGSLIVLFTLVALALLVCTQFSFAGAGEWIESRPRAIIGRYRDWRDGARRRKMNKVKEEITKVNQPIAAMKLKTADAVKSSNASDHAGILFESGRFDVVGDACSFARGGLDNFET